MLLGCEVEDEQKTQRDVRALVEAGLSEVAAKTRSVRIAEFRNRLEDPDRPASPTRREGRRVYVLRLGYEWSTAAGPPLITHLEVWLDPATFLPVRIQHQDRARPGG